MTALSDNSELVVFAGTVLPALLLIFRYLLKMQLSGEDIYERRAHMQGDMIAEQQQLILDLKQLEADCKERDAAALKRIRELESEVGRLQNQVATLLAKG